MTRTVDQLPEHLQSRIPQSLLDLDPSTLLARLCNAALEVIDSLPAENAYERDRWRSKVETLKTHDPRVVTSVLTRFDLKAGLSSLVHCLACHAKDILATPSAILYAHAYLDLRRELVHLALFYSGLRPRARAARGLLREIVVSRYDATVLELSMQHTGVAA